MSKLGPSRELARVIRYVLRIYENWGVVPPSSPSMVFVQACGDDTVRFRLLDNFARMSDVDMENLLKDLDNLAIYPHKFDLTKSYMSEGLPKMTRAIYHRPSFPAFYGGVVPESTPPKEELTDAINPAHYKTKSGLEAYQVFEAFGLLKDHYVCTAVKYLLRLGKKDSEKQELEKAMWYLNRRLELLKEASNGD